MRRFLQGRRLRLGVLLLPIFLCFPTNQASTEEMEWQLYEGGESQHWTYIIYKPKQVNATHLIYFLHGAGGDTHSWLGSFKTLRDKWTEGGRPLPIVVSVSFGPKWLLVPSGKLGERGLLDLFWQEVVPSIESKLQDRITRRDVIGQSMGGYNALQLALDRPEFFDSLVLISPVVLDLSPYAGEKEICAYGNRTGTYSYKQKLMSFVLGRDACPQPIDIILETMRMFIPDHESWENTSILHNARQKFNPQFPLLYVSCGKMDTFGLHEGVKILTDIAKEKGVHVEFHLLDGGHMVQDDRSIIEFLINNQSL